MTQRLVVAPGEKYARLTILGEAEHPRYRMVRCRCDCGKEVTATLNNLRKGHTRSCGCLLSETMNKGKHFFGPRQRQFEPEYHVWLIMKQRCLNPKAKAFVNYGKRGITVADSWRSSFWNFLRDMGRRPKGAYSIERLDNDGPYSPENCRWATSLEQACNKRTNTPVTKDGLTLPLTHWAKRVGLPQPLVRARIKRGWSHERALSTPTRKHPLSNGGNEV